MEPRLAVVACDQRLHIMGQPVDPLVFHRIADQQIVHHLLMRRLLGRDGRSRSRHRRKMALRPGDSRVRSEEHTSELQSLMRISYAVFCLKKKNKKYDLRQPIQYNTTQ